jgi:hypothetical protein
MLNSASAGTPLATQNAPVQSIFLCNEASSPPCDAAALEFGSAVWLCITKVPHSVDILSI